MVEKKHNYFYKITNLVNGKYYYGIHSTNNLDDGYLGGGTLLLRAYKKYGRENFTKEILADYPTRKEASDHEARVVTLELIKLEECYNCRTGGDNEFTHSEAVRLKMSENRKGEKHPNFGKLFSVETKLKISKAKIGKKRTQPVSEETRSKISKLHKGRKRSEETCKKMSENMKGKVSAFKGKHHSKYSKELLMENYPHKTKCLIEEVIYKSYREAARFYDIAMNSVRHRVLSDDIKWKNWKKYED